jgi:hypothetical protein
MVLFVALTLGGFALLGASEAQAQAIVINDQGCGLLDGDGNFVFASSDHTVITNSANGNCHLKCSVKGVGNSTGKAAHFDNASTGLPCGTACGLTNNWRETVSASGNATLTCHVP